MSLYYIFDWIVLSFHQNSFIIGIIAEIRCYREAL